VERAMVEIAMKQAGNNQTHAAKLLDISAMHSAIS